MFVKEIKKFLSSGGESIEFNLGCPDILSKDFEKSGGVVDFDSMDTNGWQWDWWLEAIYKGTKYTLHGSGFYGSCSIYKGDD